MTHFTFITPVLNRADTIGRALDSVAACWQAGDEHLVIDGGSEDGTGEVVARSPHATWIAAPGSGIYDALNLGIMRARRAHIILVNSDDWVIESGIAAIRQVLSDAPGLDLIRGHACFAAAPEAESWAPLRSPRLALTDVFHGPLCINGFAFSHRLFDELGGFDRRWRVAADREWMLRAWLAGYRPFELEHSVYCYRMHAGSLTIRPDQRASVAAIREHFGIIESYLEQDCPAALRVQLHRWEAREIGRLVRARLAGSTTPDLPRRIRVATRRNPLWPAALVEQWMRRRGSGDTPGFRTRTRSSATL
jgi:glycosyltransferase involved in cell wall biosynthesis